MPRDVILGEGYDGDTQVTVYAPGHHSGQYALHDGSTTLMQYGDIPSQGFNGMGDLAANFAQMFASGGLDQLRNSLNSLQASVVDASSRIGPVFDGYMEAKSLQDDAANQYGLTIDGPFGTPIPNPVALPAMVAYATAVEGVQQLARLVQQTAELVLVYTKIGETLFANGLTTDADMVNTSLYTVNRILQEIENKFVGSDAQHPVVPEYQQTRQQLITAFKNELAVQGVDQNAYDDPRWYQAFLKSADTVVPVPGMDAGSISGLGLDPATISLIIAGIIKLVVVVGLILVAMKAVAQLIPDQNLQAREAAKIAQQRATDWTTVETQMRAQGKSEADINAARTSWNSQTKQQMDSIPKPPSLLESIAGPVGVMLAAGIAIMAINK